MGGMAGEDAEDEGSDALICPDCDGCVEDAGREEEGICDFVGDEGEVSISESETILGALELVFAPVEELLVILSRSLDANLLVVVDPDALLALTIEFREEEVAICDCCSISSLTMGNGHSTRSTLSSLSSRLTRTFHSASSHLHFAVLFTTRFFPSFRFLYLHCSVARSQKLYPRVRKRRQVELLEVERWSTTKGAPTGAELRSSRDPSTNAGFLEW